MMNNENVILTRWVFLLKIARKLQKYIPILYMYKTVHNAILMVKDVHVNVAARGETSCDSYFVT